jgi:heavy metal sensor kinase
VKPIALRLRLSLLVSLLVVIVTVVLSVSAYIELEESLLRNTDELLRVMGEGIAAALNEPAGEAQRGEQIRAIASSGGSRRPLVYRIWEDGQESDLYTGGSLDVSYLELLLHPPDVERPEVGAASLFNSFSYAGSKLKDRYRLLWMRQTSGQRVVNVLVGHSSGTVYHEMGEFCRLLLVLGGSMTLIAVVLVPVLISWGLRPIARAEAQLGAMTHKSLRQKNLLTTEVPPELQPFVAAMNDLLVRIDKAMQRQERFIADAAHELRTPLAVIKSTLQVTRLQRRSDAEYEQSIDESLRDVGRMEGLMEQLLSLARLDEAQGPAGFVPVRLDLLLDDLVKVFNGRASQQGGRVVTAQAEALEVRGDENELRQLFSNLLDNAVRHGPPQGTTRVTMQAGPDGWVAVTVHDEGGGIPPEALAHVFDRFYRVDPSRSQVSGGSGLGLTIAQEIARRHQGDIEIRSDPRSGTSVMVRLPGPPVYD